MNKRFLISRLEDICRRLKMTESNISNDEDFKNITGNEKTIPDKEIKSQTSQTQNWTFSSLRNMSDSLINKDVISNGFDHENLASESDHEVNGWFFILRKDLF